MWLRLLVIVLSGGLAIGLLHWSEQPGHHLSKWVIGLAALPLFWLAFTDDDDNDNESTAGRLFNRFGQLYLAGAGLFMIFLGFVGLSLGTGGIGALFALALPIGVVLVVIAVARIWFDSR